ncbi:MAG: hypothetical protein ABL883_13210 [Terricaulis sp.]
MKRFISIRAFCDAYCVGRTRTYDLIAAGKLQAVKNGPRTMIDAESAEQWAASLPRFKSGAALARAAETA